MHGLKCLHTDSFIAAKIKNYYVAGGGWAGRQHLEQIIKINTTDTNSMGTKDQVGKGVGYVVEGGNVGRDS